MTHPIDLNALGMTAFWTASARAREGERPDRLFVDPWAAALAGPQGAAWIAQRPPDSTLPMVLRTRFFDDFLQRLAGQEDIRQIVLLAAGLDTRAFRLAWPAGTCLFELDQPAVLHHKQEILGAAGAQATCERHAVERDLTQPWESALVEAGFDPHSPSVWLLEGFLFYLPPEAITRILDTVTRLAAAGSWVGFDIVNQAVLTSPYTKAWVDMQAQAGAPWIGTLEDPQEFLAQRGWKAGLSQAGQPDAHHGRWTLPVLPTRMPNMPHNWYVTAQKN